MASSSSSHHHPTNDVVRGEVLNEGCWETSLKGDIYRFINCGGGTKVVDRIMFEDDSQVIADTETVTAPPVQGAGKYAFLYESGRTGNFKYVFDQVPEGFYFVDLHFSEQDPKRRTFDVLIQGTRVLEEFDILDTTGGLCIPTSLFNTRVRVKRDGIIVVQGSACNEDDAGPLIRGICIRKSASMQCPCCGTTTETLIDGLREEMKCSFVGQHEKGRKELRGIILRRRLGDLSKEFFTSSHWKAEREVHREHDKLDDRTTQQLHESDGS